MLLLTITASLSVLAQTGASVAEAVGASVEIFAVIDRAPAIPNDWASKSDDDRATELRLATGDAAGCAFENIVFSYASRPDLRVLDGLTLRIPAKSRAALGCVEIKFRAPHAIDATLWIKLTDRHWWGRRAAGRRRCFICSNASTTSGLAGFSSTVLIYEQWNRPF